MPTALYATCQVGSHLRRDSIGQREGALIEQGQLVQSRNMDDSKYK